MNRFASSLHWSFWSSKKTIICHYYVEAVEQVCTRSELDQNLFVFLGKWERDIFTLPEVVLNIRSNKHLTLSWLQALFGRTRLGKTGFWMEGSDLIHNLREDRLRHASGPVHSHPILYIYYYETSQNDQKKLTVLWICFRSYSWSPLRLQLSFLVKFNVKNVTFTVFSFGHLYSVIFIKSS